MRGYFPEFFIFLYHKTMRWLQNKEVLRIQLMNVLLLIVVGAVLFYDPPTAVQLAGLVGVVWLALLLIAPRLLKVVALRRWHKDFLQIAKQSKWMGIWTAIWFWLHGWLVLFVYLDSTSILAIVTSAVQRETVLGTASLFILLLLALISNNWSYHHIKAWKHLNMLIWLVVPFGFTYAILASLRFTGEWPMFAVLALFPLMALAGVTAQFRQDADYFARLRSGLLVGGSILSLLATYFL